MNFVQFRFTTTLSCMMDLRHYPLDSQNCTVEIESCKQLDIVKTKITTIKSYNFLIRWLYKF